MLIMTRSKNYDSLEMAKSNIQVIPKLVATERCYDEDYILIFEGFEDDANFISYIKFLSFFAKAKVYYIYSSKYEIAMQIQDMVKCVEIEPNSCIDRNLLEYILYDDNVSKGDIKLENEEMLVQNIIDSQDVEFFISNIRNIKMLCVNLIQEKEEKNKLVERMQVQNVEMANIKDNMAKLQKSYDDIIDGYKVISDRFHKVHTAYKKCVYSEKQFSRLHIKEYDLAPTVIYLKEYEELIHFNSFIKTLKRNINERLQSSCKVIHLVNDNYRNKILAVDSDWYVCNNEFNLRSVYTRDYIKKGGNYENLLDTLLKNELDIRYLIIVDSLNLDKDVVAGTYYKFNLCRNVKHLTTYGLSKETSVVNNCDIQGYMSYNTLDKELYGQLDEDSRYLMLSRNSAITEIVDTLHLTGK